MKKVLSILIKILLIIIIAQMFFIPTSNASTLDEIISGGDAFLEQGKHEAKTNVSVDTEGMQTAIGNLYNILFGIGVVVTVLIGGALGIKLMSRKYRGKSQNKRNINTIYFRMCNNIWRFWNMEISSKFNF